MDIYSGLPLPGGRGEKIMQKGKPKNEGKVKKKGK